jgi:hypothetical protein
MFGDHAMFGEHHPGPLGLVDVAGLRWLALVSELAPENAVKLAFSCLDRDVFRS